jgi:hypothetical protein
MATNQATAGRIATAVAATRAVAAQITSHPLAPQPVRTPADEAGVPGRPDRPVRVASRRCTPCSNRA